MLQLPEQVESAPLNGKIFDELQDLAVIRAQGFGHGPEFFVLSSNLQAQMISWKRYRRCCIILVEKV